MGKNASRVMHELVVFGLALALVAVALIGCSSGAPAEDEAPEATAPEAATQEEQAPAGETYTGQVEYGGITFTIPDGWTAVVTDSALAMEFPDEGASDASVQGTITRGAAAEGDEQGSVDAYVDGILEVLSEQEGYKLADYSATVEGVPSKAVKCSLSANDKTVEVYAVAVAANGNIVNLIMASSEGEYNAEFEAIVGSIALA